MNLRHGRYTQTQTNANMHKYIKALISTQYFTHTYIYTYVYIYTQIGTYTYICAHTNMPKQSTALISTRDFTYKYTYMYIYIYTQIIVRMCEVGKYSMMKLGPSKRLHKQIKQTQDEPQWIVAQRLLSALTIPGFSQVVCKRFIISIVRNGASLQVLLTACAA